MADYEAKELGLPVMSEIRNRLMLANRKCRLRLLEMPSVLECWEEVGSERFRRQNV